MFLRYLKFAQPVSNSNLLGGPKIRYDSPYVLKRNLVPTLGRAESLVMNSQFLALP